MPIILSLLSHVLRCVSYRFVCPQAVSSAHEMMQSPGPLGKGDNVDSLGTHVRQQRNRGMLE